MLAIRSAFSLAFLIAGSISMLTQLSTEARGQSRCESRSSASCTKKGESFSCSGITYPKEFYCRCYLTDDGCVEDNLPSHIFRLDTATDAVKELQKKLGVKKVTGILDRDTVKSIRKFQEAKGLKVDGIIGRETLKKLFAPPATK